MSRRSRSSTKDGQPRWLAAAPVVAALLAVELVAAASLLVLAHRQPADASVRLAGADLAHPVVAPKLVEPAELPELAEPPDPAEIAPAIVRPRPAPPPPPPQPAAPPAPPAGAHGSDSARAFAAEFPAQAAARQSADPVSRHWAVLVGVNDYEGRTRDNIGSAQDALVLREILLARGWRDENILLLTDRAGSHDRIVRGLEWLARSTDETSTVIFSFSGHVRQSSANPDGDAETLDEGLWASDNRYVWDADLSRMLAIVRAARMWVTIQGCEGAGFNDDPMELPGRVITYSSREDQKSHEDPEVGYSVQGFYMIVEAWVHGFADLDGDGRTSVQEAFGWGAPRVNTRTSNRQSPIMVDTLGAPFYLEVGGR